MFVKWFFAAYLFVETFSRELATIPRKTLDIEIEQDYKLELSYNTESNSLEIPGDAPDNFRTHPAIGYGGRMDFALTKEQIMFKKEVIRFAKKEIVPQVEEHDSKGEFDFESFRKMGEFGILGLHFPEEYGGSGADVVTTVVAGEALGEAGVDGGLTLSYGAHTFLCADTIFCHGTEEQKKKFIPKLCTGE